MKQRFKKWWFSAVILPYIRKNKAATAIAMRDTIVYQMWAANVPFPMINRWLARMKMDTIKGYVMEGDNPRLFYVLPEGERRMEIEKLYGSLKRVW